MQERKPREGIDLLRYACELFSSCRETFNQEWTATALLNIADACQRIDWDILPDQWSEDQLRVAAERGDGGRYVPHWREIGGRVVPVKP